MGHWVWRGNCTDSNAGLTHQPGNPGGKLGAPPLR